MIDPKLQGLVQVLNDKPGLELGLTLIVGGRAFVGGAVGEREYFEILGKGLEVSSAPDVGKIIGEYLSAHSDSELPQFLHLKQVLMQEAGTTSKTWLARVRLESVDAWWFTHEAKFGESTA